VDVLVELTGHTANNRLGTMAMRPAPVQARANGCSFGKETAGFYFFMYSV
jgi:predicted O-linked N-acetylglucosamine transferase (SPINDLY family)